MPSAEELIKKFEKRERRPLRLIERAWEWVMWKIFGPPVYRRPTREEIEAIFNRPITFPDGTVRQWVPEGPIMEISSDGGAVEVVPDPKRKEDKDVSDPDGH